jgi:Cu/Ag efflux protein CusF
MKKSVYKSAVLSAFILLAINADAAGNGVHKGIEGAASAAALPVADGEVEDVDMSNKYVILKHGPIKNLNMSGMTMAFAVKHPALLSRLKVGDRVKFTTENVGEVATITSLSVQK